MIKPTNTSKLDDAPGFLQRIVEWDWDWGVVLSKVLEISKYHIETHGWKAWLTIFIIIIFTGMAFPPTRHLTSLTLSNLFRGFGYVFGLVFSFFTFKAAETVIKSFASQVRRAIKGISRPE